MCVWSLTKTGWEAHWADQRHWFWHRRHLAQVTSLKGYKWFKWSYTFPSFPTIYSCKTTVKNLRGDSISEVRIQEGCERKRERCRTTGGIGLSLLLARSHGHRRWMPASHLLAVVPYSPPQIHLQKKSAWGKGWDIRPYEDFRALGLSYLISHWLRD